MRMFISSTFNPSEKRFDDRGQGPFCSSFIPYQSKTMLWGLSGCAENLLMSELK